MRRIDWQYVIQDFIEIRAIVNMNVINHVMLENIDNIKIVSVEKRHLIG